MASLGHPCKFQWVSLLGSVTAWHSSIGRQPNFAALNRVRHLYSAGWPSRWALAHILVLYYVSRSITCVCSLWPPIIMGRALYFLAVVSVLYPPCLADAGIIFMAALCNRGAIIFLPCGYYLSFFLSFFIPRLISAAGDWMSTILPHMVWP